MTLGASGSTYTAPANGKIYLRKSTTAAKQYIALIKIMNDVTMEAGVAWSVGDNQDIYANMEVRKGEVFKINYNAKGSATSEFFRFVYAEGEN